MPTKRSLVLAVLLPLASFTSASGCSSTSEGSGDADGGGGGGGGTGSVGTCTIQGGKVCFDYPGSSYTTATINSSCPKTGGVRGTGSCPTAMRVGSCTVFGGQGTEQTVRYYAPGFTTQSAETNCKAQSGGAFAAN